MYIVQGKFILNNQTNIRFGLYYIYNTIRDTYESNSRISTFLNFVAMNSLYKFATNV